MIQYNIYKELDTGERILIQTVNNVRQATFKADEVGDIKYVITKIDDRGESKETVGNEIIVLCKPSLPIIIENTTTTQLQLTPSSFTPNLLVEKSYDNIFWKQIYKGINTTITLDKEVKQTFYRYFTYTEYSISKPSDVLLYDPIDLPDINLNTQQISKTKFLLTWDNSYYLRYKIKINNKEIILTNESNNIELDIIDEVMYIEVYAYKGMKEKMFNTFFISQTIPSAPINLTVKTNDKIVQLNWNKEPNTNYTLYIDDELIFENQKIEDIFTFEKDYGIYNIKLYAVNFMGQSTDYANGIIKIIEQPKLFKLINTINSNNITQVQIEILDDISNTYDIKLYNSDYLNINYKFKLFINNNSIIPKYLLKEFSKLQYVDTSEYNSTYISKLSKEFRYVKPRPIQPELTYAKLSQTPFGIDTYLFTWTTNESNMAYSIYKNGILMKRFDNNISNYVMSCLEGDTVCIHSHIGYEDAESNVIIIGESLIDIISFDGVFTLDDIDGNFDHPFLD